MGSPQRLWGSLHPVGEVEGGGPTHEEEVEIGCSQTGERENLQRIADSDPLCSARTAAGLPGSACQVCGVLGGQWVGPWKANWMKRLKHMGSHWD